MYNNIKQAFKDLIKDNGDNSKMKEIYKILNAENTNPDFFIYSIKILFDLLNRPSSKKEVISIVDELSEKRCLDLLGDKANFLLKESKDIFEKVFFELIILYYTKGIQETFITTIKKYHHFEKSRHTMMFRDIITAFMLVISYLNDMQTLPFYCWSIIMLQDYRWGVKHFSEVLERSTNFCYELDLNLYEEHKLFSEHYETMYLKYQCKYNFKNEVKQYVSCES